LRNPLKMQIVSDVFEGSGFALFANVLKESGNQIRAIPAPKGGSRAFCDRMNAFAQKEGLPGMGYIFWRKEEGKVQGVGPIAKNIGEEKTEEIRKRLQLEEGDACFFLGGKARIFEPVAAKARNEIATALDLLIANSFEFCWIVDFPLFEEDEETGGLQFSHNPFSMPQGGIDALNKDDPLEVLGFQYDIVCNGVELSSGAVRNHIPEIMYKAFEIVGKSKEFVDENFGGMINAFKFGAPPHAGIAPGIDRIVMLLANAQNIREVILFPMNQGAEDLMMEAPANVSNEQLRELGLRIIPKE
jgi:aspartyl-tRNA synthetase